MISAIHKWRRQYSFQLDVASCAILYNFLELFFIVLPLSKILNSYFRLLLTVFCDSKLIWNIIIDEEPIICRIYFKEYGKTERKESFSWFAYTLYIHLCTYLLIEKRNVNHDTRASLILPIYIVQRRFNICHGRITPISRCPIERIALSLPF